MVLCNGGWGLRNLYARVSPSQTFSYYFKSWVHFALHENLGVPSGCHGYYLQRSDRFLRRMPCLGMLNLHNFALMWSRHVRLSCRLFLQFSHQALWSMLCGWMSWLWYLSRLLHLLQWYWLILSGSNQSYLSALLSWLLCHLFLRINLLSVYRRILSQPHSRCLSALFSSMSPMWFIWYLRCLQWSC